MGLFFGGYDKPGAGVDPNAPKKKGVFLYLELVARKFSKFLQAGFLFSLFSLPVIIITYIMSAFLFVQPISALQTTALETMTEAGVEQSLISGQLGTITFFFCIMASVFFVTMWGSGPLSAGLSFVFRSFTREQPVWVWSDGKDKVRENLKQGFAVMAIDFVVFIFVPFAITFYYNLSKMTGMSFICTLIIYVLLIAVLIYTMMHPYMYQLMITFECSFRDLFKNSLLLAIGRLPVNLLLTAISLAGIVLPVAFGGVIGGMVISVIGLTAGYIILRYPMEFYAARGIEKMLLNNKTMAKKNAPEKEYEEEE